MNPDKPLRAPAWLPLLAAILAGFQIFIWLSVLLVFTGLLLGLAAVPSSGLEGRLLRVTSVVLAGIGVLVAAWASVYLGRRVKRRLVLASFATVVFWFIALLALTVVGPAPFIYTLK